MSKTSKTPNEKLLDYINIYLASMNYTGTNYDELEVRFGTKFWNPITQIDFNNVISKIKSSGFHVDATEGTYRLTIMNQYIDERSGNMKISNIRTEIAGIESIRDYCRNNSFDSETVPNNITFNKKTTKWHEDNMLKPIDFDDFQFRVNFKEEKLLRPKFRLIQNILSKWEASRKIFRFVKRFSFTHANLPFKIDCSIVRSSSKNVRHRMIPEYRIESSNVFNNPISYEIEIELLQHRKPGASSIQKESELLLATLKRLIMLVMSGLQNSNFPIKYSEQEDILSEYMNLLWKKNRPDRRVRSSDFVGPSSISLELPNVSPINEESKNANIRMPYTTTDKADGMRKLMFINKYGIIYLIDVNMNTQFTGVLCENKQYYNTIIDGEHVLHNKTGIFINQYWAFDIYYLNKEDLRSHPFVEIKGIENSKDSKFRLVELNKVIKNLKAVSHLGTKRKLSMNFHTKTFYTSYGDDIFKNCQIILERKNENLFPYEIDGLIFTPADKGIGSDSVGEILPPQKKTWIRSFKWKPPEFNTIDFLVTTKKITGGEDYVGNIFQDGDNMNHITQLTQYKTLILRVGFDERKHGYINPCADVINDKLPSRQQQNDFNNTYKPVPFQPTNPTPIHPAYLANIVLQEVGGVQYMYTEDMKSVIEDETIVEFRYDKNEKKFWEWKPIRIRQKKTAEYRAGRRNYGNAYHVAQSVWKSIHNPISEEMITTGNGIPDQLDDDDVYYNRSGSTITKSLRDFHNLFVKRLLILGASSRGGTLIDMSVGKGGDFSKWIAAKLSFVFGLDIARDNIENRLDGACARFLNYRKRFHSMPHALFVNANSGLNIRSGDACFTEKGKEIVKAIFGEGSQDEGKIGKGVMRQFGKGKEGFDVVSNQFSIHYFFENINVLSTFLRNVSECCKVGGYFIGTSYDGKKVFEMLEKKKAGESIHITKKGVKMWEIKKQYENERFESNKSSIGYRIDVYQESINKVFSEYLVNYEYLTTLMEDFGFTLLSRDEAKTIGLPSSMGNFNEIFNTMEEDIRTRRLKKSDVGRALAMSTDEKKISFLNKYFIFKKVRDVNAKQVAHILSEESMKQELEDIQDSIKLQNTITKGKKPKVKKLHRKLKLTKRGKSETATIIKKKLKFRKKIKIPKNK